MSGLLLLPALALSAPAPQVSPPDVPVAQAETAQVTPPPVVVTGWRRTKGDPAERLNRSLFEKHQKFDRKLLRPAAMGYRHAVPRPLRTAIRNFFANVGEPLVALNFLLQLKPGKAFETAGRFLVNSTLGIGGLVDVAAQPKIRLPHRENSLGDTLGYYGVKPGPYFFLPLIGPTTLRDLIADQAEGLILPLTVGRPFNRVEYQVPHYVLGGLDTRAEADADLKALLDDAVDPYATLRSVFLQDRAGEIAHLHGAPKAVAAPELGEPLEDPAGTKSPTVTPPASATPELQDPMSDPAAGSAPAPAAQPATPAPASNAPELNDPMSDPAATPAKP